MSMRPGFPVALVGGTAVDTGVVLAGVVARDASGNPRAGVFPRTPNATLVSSRSDMKVNVAAFEGVTSRAGQGVVFVANDATVVTDALPVPTSNSWIVVVWFRHDDSQSPNSDPDSLPVIGYTVGSASATPAKPFISDGCVELATVLIPSTATATNSSGVVITQTFLMTAAAGGTVFVRNATERDAWAPPIGSECYQVDTRLVFTRQSSTWALSGGATPHAEVFRNATDTYGATTPASFVPHGFSVTIPSAYAGIYRISGYVILGASGADSDGNLRINVQSNGGVVNNVNRDQRLKLSGTATQAVPVDFEYTHTGGDLTVSSADQRQPGGGGATVYAQSRLAVAWQRMA